MMSNLYQNREISTLSFNERVLQEAEDMRNPLMERLKFLGIFSSNMDEFFKVRVASVHRRLELGVKSMLAVLEEIGEKTRELDERFRAAYAAIIEALAQEGIRFFTERDLEKQNPELQAWIHAYFHENVLPSLVPLIVRKNGPYPTLTDGALYFGIVMSNKKDRYAFLEIPAEIPRFVQLPDNSIMYVDDVIRYFLNDIFYIFEYDRIEAFAFKISRDAELDVDDDFSEGYVRKMERGLQKRKGGRPVRLVYDVAMVPELLNLLRKALKTIEDTVISGGRYHNMKDLMRFPRQNPELAFEKKEPAPHPVLDRKRTPMLDIIQKQDVLLTYPYQSFDHFVRLLREAAIDPKVEEIRMTLYRVAVNSQVVNALASAAQNRKKVFVVIELQARFDEQNNILISQKLSEAGATVVFGVPPMKVHAKLLFIRRGKKNYAALSTGNFNEITGKLYVDSTLFTANPGIVSEVAEVFEFLKHASKRRMLAAPKFKHLLVSPFNMRKTIFKLLARERAKGKDGYILLKANHLTDAKLIKSIRTSAEKGVLIDLVIRTTYTMRSQKNIRAISILDRYLEHQRIFIFGTGEDRHVILSSADLMERNLDWRIEVAFPVYDKKLQQQIADMMVCQVTDNTKARILDETQSNQYANESVASHRAQYDTHRYFEELYTRETKLPLA